MTEEADRMRKQPEEWLDVCDNQGNPTGEQGAAKRGTPGRNALTGQPMYGLIRRRPAGGF